MNLDESHYQFSKYHLFSFFIFNIIYIFIYNILGFVQLRWSWSSFPSIRLIICHVIHPSKFLIPEEEDDGRGGGGKTPVVLQFAKSYKLILKN